jgi:hypothetical protein
MPPAKWPALLEAMGDGDRVVSDLCDGSDVARRATRNMLATMVKRGLVEKRPNPEPPTFELHPGIVSRRKDIWLYHRTEKGARVAAGSDEWRKTPDPEREPLAIQEAARTAGRIYARSGIAQEA